MILSFSIEVVSNVWLQVPLVSDYSRPHSFFHSEIHLLNTNVWHVTQMSFHFFCRARKLLLEITHKEKVGIAYCEARKGDIEHSVASITKAAKKRALLIPPPK